MRTIDKAGWTDIIKQAVAFGQSQRQIAQRLGVSPGSVSIYCRANGLPSLGRKGAGLLKRRAKAYEPTLRELAEVKRFGAEDIGPKLGVHPNTARRYMKLLGIDFPTNGRTVLRYDTTGWSKDVLKWHRQGKSTKEIAKLKGVSPSTIYRYLANGGHIAVRERDTNA